MAGRVVEIAGRLVGEQNLRRVGERTCDGNPLLLASGELGRKVVTAPGETDTIDELASAVGRSGSPAQLEGHLHVLLCSQRGNELKALKNEAHLFTPQPRPFVLGESAEI